jgi:hypothetical protein
MIKVPSIMHYGGNFNHLELGLLLAVGTISTVVPRHFCVTYFDHLDLGLRPQATMMRDRSEIGPSMRGKS